MENRSVISGTGLSVGYKTGGNGPKVIHRNLSFSLKSRELTCLLGPNGAGKSTLLRTLGASQPPLSGQLLLEGREIGQYGEKEISGKIGLVLTERTLAGGLTVSELVGLGRYPHTGFFGRLKPDDYACIEKAMSLTGITDKASSYISELSDGERQKAMIAKAIAQECPIILLDEPTAFLDVASRIEMMNLLHRLAQKSGKTILLSTHDLEQALLLSDRLWLLSRQHGLCCGATEDLVLSGEIDRYFCREGISFDQASGNFKPTFHHSRKVAIESTEAVLSFWTKNLLMRNGFDYTSDTHEAEFSLKLISATQIEIHRNGHPAMICSDFDELSAALRVF